MAAVLEQRQGHMAGRQLVVAANAVIGGMTRSAVLTIDGRKLSVNVVAPARGVGHRRHDQMTGDALRLGIRRRHAVLVTRKTLRVRSRRHGGMVLPEIVGVKLRLHVPVKVRGYEAGAGG